MVREIVNTAGAFFTLHLPQDMIGKKVEIIAFEIDERKEGDLVFVANADKIKEIQNITKRSLVDLSNYKFNRDKANNYDE